MTIKVTTFRWVPPFAQGYVKDLRVRWALEEAGLPYDMVLVSGPEVDSDAYRRLQPFGQVPVYQDDDIALFESGAIILHIATRCPALAVPGPIGHARATAWVFAALNSIEPFAQNYIPIAENTPPEAWAAGPGPALQDILFKRLAGLAQALGDAPYLEDQFTAGDIAMTTVLRELKTSGALTHFPVLDRYVDRCEARPAFQRALEGQLETFRRNAP